MHRYCLVWFSYINISGNQSNWASNVTTILYPTSWYSFEFLPKKNRTILFYLESYSNTSQVGTILNVIRHNMRWFYLTNILTLNFIWIPHKSGRLWILYPVKWDEFIMTLNFTPTGRMKHYFIPRKLGWFWILHFEFYDEAFYKNVGLIPTLSLSSITVQQAAGISYNRLKRIKKKNNVPTHLTRIHSLQMEEVQLDRFWTNS